MLKMCMITYNEAIDNEVMEILEKTQAKNYTKTMGVFGKGETSGIHLGDDIWPGRNNILQIICEEKTAKELMTGVRQLRKTLGKEGVKAFILPIEEQT